MFQSICKIRAGYSNSPLSHSTNPMQMQWLTMVVVCVCVLYFRFQCSVPNNSHQDYLYRLSFMWFSHFGDCFLFYWKVVSRCQNGRKKANCSHQFRLWLTYWSILCKRSIIQMKYLMRVINLFEWICIVFIMMNTTIIEINPPVIMNKSQTVSCTSSDTRKPNQNINKHQPQHQQ